MKTRRIALLFVLFVLGCTLGIFLYPPLVRWLIGPLNGHLIINDLHDVFRTRLYFALLCGVFLSATCLCTLISRPGNIVLTTIVYFTMGSALSIFYAFYCQNSLASIAYDFQLTSATNGMRATFKAADLPLLKFPLVGIGIILFLSLVHRFCWPRKGWEPMTD